MNTKTFTAHFHMLGGQTLTTENVVSVSLERNSTTGDYLAYRIKWAEGKTPELFSLSIPHLIGVTTS